MKSLRSRFERWCFKNRNKGIPNLMLYLSVGSGIVFLFTMFSRNAILYELLRFDLDLILKGQVWRLFSYVITTNSGDLLFTLITLVCYYSLGRAMENVWGTFRFNLFYLTGVLLMDLFAVVVRLLMPQWVPYLSYVVDVYYLNMSLFLGYATLYPDAQFLLLFIIPVRAWIFALLDLAMTVIEVINLSVPDFLFPINLFPLVAIANYFLFFGKDVLNVIPASWRANTRRLFRKKPKTAEEKRRGTIPFPNAGSYEATVATVKKPYTHKCRVCGRTDASNPELEFRYCSRCTGYQCYCEEHINQHEHIQ